MKTKLLCSLLVVLPLGIGSALAADWTITTGSGDFHNSSIWTDGVPDDSKKLEVSSGHIVTLNNGQEYTIGNDGDTPVDNNTKINGGNLHLVDGQLNFSSRIHLYGNGNLIIGSGSGEEGKAIYNGTAVVFGSTGTNGTAEGNGNLVVRQGGVLTLSSQFIMGNNHEGTSYYIQDGGTANFNNAFNTGNLANSTNGKSVIQISGGNATVASASAFSRYNGTKTELTISGGELKFNNALTLSNATGSSVDVEISNGKLTGNGVTIGLGNESRTSINISGGEMTMSSTSRVGRGTGSSTDITISGGKMQGAAAITFGEASGSTVNVTLNGTGILSGSGLNFGNGTNATVTLNISDSARAEATNIFHFGRNRTDFTLNMDGGQIIASEGQLGNYAHGGRGNLNVSGGEITLNSTKEGAFTLGVNRNSRATLNMTGGIINSNGSLVVLNGNNSTADIKINGGTLNIKGASFAKVGNSSATVNLGGNALIAITTTEHTTAYNADLSFGNAEATSVTALFGGNSRVTTSFSPTDGALTAKLHLDGANTAVTITDRANIQTYGLQMDGASTLTFLVANQNFQAGIDLNDGNANIGALQMDFLIGALRIASDARIIIDLSTFTNTSGIAGIFSENLISNAYIPDLGDFLTVSQLDSSIGSLIDFNGTIADGITNPLLEWVDQGGNVYDLKLSFQYAIPEPSTYAAMLGIFTLAIVLRMRRKK